MNWKNLVIVIDDSINDIYRNMHINNNGKGVIGLLSVRDDLDEIEAIFNEVEDSYIVRDNDEDW